MKKTLILAGLTFLFSKSYSQDIIDAIRENDIIKVAKLAENKKKLNATGKNGVFALFSAAAEGNVEIGKILIDRAASVNQTLKMVEQR